MDNKEKLTQLIEDKNTQIANLRSAIVKGETEEARQEMADAITALEKEILNLQAIVDGMKEKDDGEMEGRSMVIASQTTTTVSTAEARAQGLMNTGAMSVPASETRSTLITTDSIAKPTGVGGINDPHNTVSSIVDMVQVEDMTGMGAHTEAYVVDWQEADALTDGTAPTGSDPVFKTCAVNPFLLGCVSYVSRELKKQSPLQYEEKVREGAFKALRKKVAQWIVNGNGTAQIYGIANAVNTKGEKIVEELNLAAGIDEKTLRNIVFAYGGDENVGANAVLFLNKEDLTAFGDVRANAEKSGVYEIIPDGSNPNCGVIKDGGLAVPYCICSAATDMLYGDPTNYKLGLYGPMEVRVSEDYKFGEGLLTVRAEAMVGGNVVVDKGFIIVKKGA